MLYNYTTTPRKKQTIDALWRLEKIILNNLDFKSVVQKIVDSVLTELDVLKLSYRIVVLVLFDKQENTLRRISISQTETARKALLALPMPFKSITIPVEFKENLCVKVFESREPSATSNWEEILIPAFTKEEAKTVQELVGIKESLVYPVISKNESIGVIIFSMSKTREEVTEDERDLIAGFTDVVGLAVQNARLYTKLEDTSEKLKQANERLKELDNLKDEFVSIASHELRTPMTAIKSYLWMALAGRGGEINEKQKYYLDRAYISVDRLIKLVNDMLNVSRIEAGRVSLSVQKVDMIKLTDDVIAEVKPRADELGLHIVLQPAELPPVIADVDKIKEVMINLIGNSLKFTQKDGTITISFEVQEDKVVTHVKDNGVGIEKDDITKLFQKFGLMKGSYTTNQTASQGTGLGLYICKSIMQLHKGDIWVESEGKGKGSTFSFYLRVFDQKLFEQIEKEQEGKEGIEIIHTGLN